MSDKLTSEGQGLELDQLYDRLLFDEEFQELRTKSLKALPSGKAMLLNENDQNLIANKKIPDSIAKKILLNYIKNLDCIGGRKSSFLRQLANTLSDFNFSYPVISGGSLVAISFLLGVTLSAGTRETKSILREIFDNRPDMRQGIAANPLDDDMTDGYPMDNISALNEKADRYMYGLGVAQNYNKALSLYKEAAKQGSKMAQYKIDLLYHQGFGIEVDEKANYWFQEIRRNDLGI